MTPRTVWFLYDRLNQDRAQDRLLTVSDTKVVVGSVVSQEGHKLFLEHLRALTAQAGKGSSPYTENNLDADE